MLQSGDHTATAGKKAGQSGRSALLCSWLVWGSFTERWCRQGSYTKNHGWLRELGANSEEATITLAPFSDKRYGLNQTGNMTAWLEHYSGQKLTRVVAVAYPIPNWHGFAILFHCLKLCLFYRICFQTFVICVQSFIRLFGEKLK